MKTPSPAWRDQRETLAEAKMLRAQRIADRCAAVVRLVRLGQPRHEIASTLSVASTTVDRIAHAAGVRITRAKDPAGSRISCPGARPGGARAVEQPEPDGSASVADALARAVPCERLGARLSRGVCVARYHAADSASGRYAPCYQCAGGHARADEERACDGRH